MTETPKPPKSGPGPRTDSAEPDSDALLDAGAETVEEMMDAMQTMMGASAKMMQSFIDMRLSYLKVMRSMTEDPSATMTLMSRNMRDLAEMTEKKRDGS